MSSQEPESVAADRLDDVREHLRLLAADTEAQNAYLHPCGWTLDQPYEHTTEHQPCAPMGELCDGFDDMWPNWRELLEPLLTDERVAALDAMSACLADYFSVPYIDELATLDGSAWAEVRCVARTTLQALDSGGS